MRATCKAVMRRQQQQERVYIPIFVRVKNERSQREIGSINVYVRVENGLGLCVRGGFAVDEGTIPPSPPNHRANRRGDQKYAGCPPNKGLITTTKKKKKKTTKATKNKLLARPIACTGRRMRQWTCLVDDGSNAFESLLPSRLCPPPSAPLLISSCAVARTAGSLWHASMGGVVVVVVIKAADFPSCLDGS